MLQILTIASLLLPKILLVSAVLMLVPYAYLSICITMEIVFITIYNLIFYEFKLDLDSLIGSTVPVFYRSSNRTARTCGAILIRALQFASNIGHSVLLTVLIIISVKKLISFSVNFGWYYYMLVQGFRVYWFINWSIQYWRLWYIYRCYCKEAWMLRTPTHSGTTK